jgi:hypothetical protein
MRPKEGKKEGNHLCEWNAHVLPWGRLVLGQEMPLAFAPGARVVGGAV